MCDYSGEGSGIALDQLDQPEAVPPRQDEADLLGGARQVRVLDQPVDRRRQQLEAAASFGPDADVDADADVDGETSRGVVVKRRLWSDWPIHCVA